MMSEFSRPFSFVLPTKIHFGPGSLAQLSSELQAFGISKPLIVTDAGVAKAGIVARVLKALPPQSEGILFDSVEANPKDYNVTAGARLYRDSEADGIIALGGGSPIDCAKAIAVLVANAADDIRAFEGRNVPSKPLPPLLAVPTTAGTGSELTYSVVITDTSRNFKMTVKNAYTAPDVAICDPLLTLTVPPAVTAATGMDALTHAIEAYTATCAEPISDAVALYAIELIAANLVTAFKDGHDLEARSRMLMGSMLAGIAFSHSDVAGVHCIAEALGGMYDLAHGVCNAVILPHMMAYAMDYCQERYARVARAMSVTPDTGLPGAKAAVEAVQRLAREVELPLFNELGVSLEDFPAIAKASFINGSTPSNPRPMSEENYLELLQIMGC